MLKIIFESKNLYGSYCVYTTKEKKKNKKSNELKTIGELGLFLSKFQKSYQNVTKTKRIQWGE